jgi:hypothetical protein
VIETDTLSDMRDIIADAVIALGKPVINMRNLV